MDNISRVNASRKDRTGNSIQRWGMRGIVAAVSVAAWTTAAGGQGCEPHWSEEFASGDLDGAASALAWFDDGTGPALYVGGSFFAAAGVPETRGIARWDGREWSSVGGGVDGLVYSMAVHDDGTGPALFVGGWFSAAGGVLATSHVAKWNGSVWSPLPGDTDSLVIAMRVFDDGSGASLYIGGNFGRAGGIDANRIAKWDGASWSPLGSGISDIVRTMDVFDDGSGPALHVAGRFVNAGGLSVEYLAKWTGQSWEAASPPPYGPRSGGIWDLVVWDDGAGPALYATGRFEDNGVTGGVARKRGGQWEVLASPSIRIPFALGPIDVGGRQGMGVAVQQIGREPGSVGAWIDGVWHHLGDVDRVPRSMLRVEGPTGPRTYLVGLLSAVGGSGVRGIAVWDGSEWSALRPPGGINGSVRALDAGVERVYAGGWFQSAGGAAAVRVAAYEGGVWSALGPGFPSTCGAGGIPSVESLLEVDLPSARGVVAGGLFSAGFLSQAIAVWDGASWAGLAQGFSVISATDTCAVVMDTAVFDDGSGPALFAAGHFDTPAWGIARWTGTAWADLAGGLGVFPWGNKRMCLRVHDDGTGPALYVGGRIWAAGGPGGFPVRNIARWNGQHWSRVGQGLEMFVFALEEFDDGRGPALFAAGASSTGGEVWRWEGAAWTRLGGRFDAEAAALAVFDDGTGPALYVGGSFTSIDGRPARALARWDPGAPGQWIEVAGGVAQAGQGASVLALEPVPHQGVWSLLVGGWFSAVGQSVDSQNIARLIGCRSVCYPDCDSNGTLDIFDFLCFQNSFVLGEPYACDCDPDPACDIFDFLCFQNAFVAGCP
ncbi:MAG: hypothetical protein IID31_10925 [Planctomycetes bacterium]|nr:hypothetical protein [Planctomycetota bacterium]